DPEISRPVLSDRMHAAIGKSRGRARAAKRPLGIADPLTGSAPRPNPQPSGIGDVQAVNRGIPTDLGRIGTLDNVAVIRGIRPQPGKAHERAGPYRVLPIHRAGVYGQCAGLVL